METGRVVSVSPRGADGLVRVVFSIQTVNGTIESAAAVLDGAGFSIGSAHYIAVYVNDLTKCDIM
jgi:hypothetical protein